MTRMFETIRSRIVAGVLPLSIGLVGTALLAAVTLRQMRHAVADELAGLPGPRETRSGLAGMGVGEICAARPYPTPPGGGARPLFPGAGDRAVPAERAPAVRRAP